MNRLEDLVAYELGESGKSLQRFAREATARLEQGQRAFTRQQAGRLVFCGWLIERPAKSPITAAEGRLDHPAGRVIVRLEEVASEELDFEAVTAGLAQILRTAAAVEGVEEILVALPAQDGRSRAAAEALGLEAGG